MNDLWNIKRREVFCTNCKEYWLSADANPKCHVSQTHVVITVVRSALDSKEGDIADARDSEETSSK